MKKAIVRPLPEEHESNYEVYVPAKLSTSGEKVRKRFKLKKEANAYADELNIKIAGDAVAPLARIPHRHSQVSVQADSCPIRAGIGFDG